MKTITEMTSDEYFEYLTEGADKIYNKTDMSIIRRWFDAGQLQEKLKAFKCVEYKEEPIVR